MPAASARGAVLTAGLYRAKVTKVRAGRLWVQIPAVAGSQEFGGPTGFQYLDDTGLATAAFLTDEAILSVTSTQVPHTHSVDVASTASSAAGAHTHSTDPAAVTSGAASAGTAHTHQVDVAASASDLSATHTHTVDPAPVTSSTAQPAITSTVSNGGSHVHSVARAPYAPGDSVLVAAIAGRVLDLVVLGRLKP